MDPVTLVLGALTAGALKGADETATAAVKAVKAVKAAYTALKAAVAARFTERKVSAAVLDEHEDDPNTYENPLAEKIRQAGAADHPRIVELAHALMRLMDDDSSRHGRHTVDVRGAKGVQIGDRSTQQNTFS